jgi:hypothetical protein
MPKWFARLHDVIVDLTTRSVRGVARPHGQAAVLVDLAARLQWVIRSMHGVTRMRNADSHGEAYDDRSHDEPQ